MSLDDFQRLQQALPPDRIEQPEEFCGNTLHGVRVFASSQVRVGDALVANERISLPTRDIATNRTVAEPPEESTLPPAKPQAKTLWDLLEEDD